MKQDYHCSGSGAITGGEYGEIRVSGDAKITGDVQCDRLHVSGGVKAANDLTCGEMHVSGSLKVEGRLSAETAKISGEVKAEKGEELLKTMIAMDDGASYLGECALVPQHSPIAESGILFYNTLFDENAACHLALGMGFADTIKDFQNKTLDECRALGINASMIHEDVMIGCDSMNIDGICEDGRVVPIFRSGNWAF